MTLIANPTVIASIRKSKASTSGVYNVDILSTAPSMLHGVRLISTSAIAATTPWLVTGAGVTYRRRAVAVEIGHDAADWSHNTETRTSRGTAGGGGDAAE